MPESIYNKRQAPGGMKNPARGIDIGLDNPFADVPEFSPSKDYDSVRKFAQESYDSLRGTAADTGIAETASDMAGAAMNVPRVRQAGDYLSDRAEKYGGPPRDYLADKLQASKDYISNLFGMTYDQEKNEVKVQEGTNTINDEAQPEWMVGLAKDPRGLAGTLSLDVDFDPYSSKSYIVNTPKGVNVKKVPGITLPEDLRKRHNATFGTRFPKGMKLTQDKIDEIGQKLNMIDDIRSSTQQQIAARGKFEIGDARGKQLKGLQEGIAKMEVDLEGLQEKDNITGFQKALDRMDFTPLFALIDMETGSSLAKFYRPPTAYKERQKLIRGLKKDILGEKKLLQKEYVADEARARAFKMTTQELKNRMTDKIREQKLSALKESAKDRRAKDAEAAKDRRKAMQIAADKKLEADRLKRSQVAADLKVKLAGIKAGAKSKRKPRSAKEIEAEIYGVESYFGKVKEDKRFVHDFIDENRRVKRIRIIGENEVEIVVDMKADEDSIESMEKEIDRLADKIQRGNPDMSPKVVYGEVMKMIRKAKVIKE